MMTPATTRATAAAIPMMTAAMVDSLLLTERLGRCDGGGGEDCGCDGVDGSGCGGGGGVGCADVLLPGVHAGASGSFGSPGSGSRGYSFDIGRSINSNPPSAYSGRRKLQSRLMKLPIQPPIQPMLARLTRELPEGEGWLYEPKWDGFRAIVFWDGEEMLIQSRDLKPLGRYFPELEAGLRDIMPAGVVVDGEVVIAGPAGLDFDSLLLRIHPAESRVRRLAAETPSSFVAFDLLAANGEDLMPRPMAERRRRLERVIGNGRTSDSKHLSLTPSTPDRALAADWFERFEGAGLDGVVAKKPDQPYLPNQRAMLKVKHQRTADCVIAGFRWNRGEEGESVGSLLLGLYDAAGVLHYVGHTSSFKHAERRELVSALAPYREDAEEAGFGHGRTPGGPSRWRQAADQAWEPLRPELVCEVSFDHLQGERFRHAATFLRWRPDKPPKDCTFDQLTAVAPYELQQIFGSNG
jgi:ATP-dependent DNA ligase